jgi:3D-(3,5/4)-trihydroxycyclohexane-1,2-dione acylhydrolase (decyclizing)
MAAPAAKPLAAEQESPPRRQDKTVRLTSAQALVRYLQQQFTERDGRRQRLIAGIFGIFGHGNVAGMGQALEECGTDLPYYQPRNEQSMVHTAAAYARARQRLATFACTASIGPGSTNMVTGAALATVNRLPVLLLPSDYYATRHQGPVLQQIEHPISADVSVNDCFRPVSRFFDRITRPEQLLTALPEAMRVLTDSAETGAAVISLPQDIQAHAWDFPARFLEPIVWRIDRQMPDRQRIQEAAQLIRSARRPMIIAGGGVHYSEAWDALWEFAEQIGIPVGETFAGRGAMRTPSEWLLGGFGITGTPSAGRIAERADLILCIGTRLTDFTTGSRGAFQCPDLRVVSINVSARDAYKIGALPIVADAREGLRELTEACRGVRTDASWAEEVVEARQEWDDRLREEVLVDHPGEILSQGQLIRILNEEAHSGDTVIAAAGGPPGDLHKLWDATGGKTCHLEFGFSCMGYEIPASLGVRLAQPEGEVFVVVGDGTYLMNPTEIVTAMQEGLKITLIISENHGFQVIRQLQMAKAGRSFGNEFRTRDTASHRLEGEYLSLDFAQNAASLGARVWKASTPEEIRAALREARREQHRPCAVVVETEKHRYLPGSGVWWDVAPAEVSSDRITQELRSRYENDRSKLQKFLY